MRDFIENSVETLSAVVESGRNHSFKFNEANVENITVLDVMNATSSNGAVEKLVKLWENNNAKRAVRGAGLATMALSLAACGSSSDEIDTTPISQEDYDAALASAAAAVTAQEAAEAAQAAAEATAADAVAAQAVAEAAAAAAATAQAAAEAAQADAEGDAAAAALAQAAAEEAQAAAEAAQATAEAATATAQAAQATAEAAQAAAETSLADMVAELAAAGFTDLTDLISSYTALITPVAYALTDDDASGVGPDAPAMTAGNDVVTGTSSTYDASDVIVDSSTTDADVLTVTATGDITAAATVVNVETINYNLNAASATGEGSATEFYVTVANVSGAANINLDVTLAGSAVSAAEVYSIANGMTINTTSDFTTVTATPEDNASYTLNVGGAAATTVVSVTDAAIANGSAADDVTINSTSALTVVATAADGDIALSAVGDIIVTDADSGDTLTASSSAGSVTVTTADGASSLTLTSADETVVTGATGATTVTVSAQGTGATGSGTTASSVTATAMTTLNVSGNGGALKIDASDSDALAAVVVSGSQSVEVVVDADELQDITDFSFVDNSTAGTSVLNINADATAAVDLVDVAADQIKLTADVDGGALSVASGANLVIANNQGGLNVDGVYATRTTNTLNLEVANDSTATSSYTVTAFDADNFASVAITANDTSEASGGVDFAAIDVATAALTLAGESDYDLDSVTAGSLTATGSGAITLDLLGAGTVKTVTTGSGNDSIDTNTTALTTGRYTISTGEGADNLVMDDANGFTIDGGAGIDTLKLDAAAGDYTALTISVSNIEVLDVEGAGGTTGANNTTQIDASMISGQTWVVKDSSNGAASVIDITVDQATVDLSGLATASSVTTYDINGETFGDVVSITFTGSAVVDNVDTGNAGDSISTGAGNDVVTSDAGDDYIDGGAGDDNLNGEDGADTILGGAGSDTITGEAGADTLNGGEGADTITGGAGNDTIILTETVAAIDDVVLSAVAANGTDTITGFAAGAGVDTVSIVTGDTTYAPNGEAADDVAAFATEATALVTSGATFTLTSNTATKDVVELTTTLDDDVVLSASSTGADLLQALSSDATEAASITVGNQGDKLFLAVYQGGDAFLFHLSSGANTAVVSSEISLVAVFEDVAAGTLASGDFIIA